MYLANDPDLLPPPEAPATEATEGSVGTGGATEGTRPPGEAHASPKESEIVSGYVFLD